MLSSSWVFKKKRGKNIKEQEGRPQLFNIRNTINDKCDAFNDTTRDGEKCERNWPAMRMRMLMMFFFLQSRPQSKKHGQVRRAHYSRHPEYGEFLLDYVPTQE